MWSAFDPEHSAKSEGSSQQRSKRRKQRIRDQRLHREPFSFQFASLNGPLFQERRRDPATDHIDEFDHITGPQLLFKCFYNHFWDLHDRKTKFRRPLACIHQELFEIWGIPGRLHYHFAEIVDFWATSNPSFDKSPNNLVAQQGCGL